MDRLLSFMVNKKWWIQDFKYIIPLIILFFFPFKSFGDSIVNLKEYFMLEQELNNLIIEWKEYVNNPKIKLSSKAEDYTDCEPYQKILNLGSAALPNLIEKIKKGEYLLWYAVRNISKVDLKESDFESEQEVANKYVKWWEFRLKKKPVD